MADYMDDDEDADLQRALALSRAEAPAAPPPPPPATPADVVVLGQIPTKFRVYAAAAAGRSDLESTGRIILPQSCLAVFSQFLGDMPSTLLLRLVASNNSSCVVGVAEFLSDEQCAALLAVAAGPAARSQPLPRLFDRGPLACCFTPRWVRGALLVDPTLPEAHLQIVSMPLATHMVLRPHADDFAAALARQGDGDVRETLTGLFNRYPAVAKGAVLALQLEGVSHLVDVLALKGNRHVRCGVAGAVVAAVDSTEPSEAVPAACLVDTNLEVDFAPSVAAEAAEAKAEEQARAALAQAQAADAERLRQAQQAADPFSAQNAGVGQALGGGTTTTAASAGMSEREKRLAALAKRGL